MTEDSRRFLDFNGTNIVIADSDGQYWIAIKPICKALGVDYINQFKKIKQDKILADKYSVQRTVAANDKIHPMACLPERFIYGWLFSIKTKSEEFKKYKKEHYDIVFNHFHGTTIRKAKMLKNSRRIN